jgi:hypothetical protein
MDLIWNYKYLHFLLSHIRYMNDYLFFSLSRIWSTS